MADELWVAGCLVLVIEGLVLAAFPAAWQQAMMRLIQLPPRQLRTGGIVAMLIGLVCLKLVKG